MREIKINPHNFKGKFNEGLESVIYNYQDDNLYDKEVLYKRYRAVEYIRGFNSSVSDNMYQNKKEKILMIPHLKCFSDEVKILDIGIENNKPLGYTLNKSHLKPITAKYEIFKDEKGNEVEKLIYYRPDRKEMSLSDKIKYLKMLKDKVVKFNDSDVYIGDFNYENFLVNNSLDAMKLCDLDNLKIWSHDFDNKTASVKKYEEVCLKNDYRENNIEGLDSFCLNVFTIALLSNEPNFIILRNLDKIELPNILDDYPNRDILDDMKHLDKTYKPRFLVDIY